MWAAASSHARTGWRGFMGASCWQVSIADRHGAPRVGELSMTRTPRSLRARLPGTPTADEWEVGQDEPDVRTARTAPAGQRQRGGQLTPRHDRLTAGARP